MKVTLACEDCKRRNYITMKSQGQRPRADRDEEVLPLGQAPHAPQGNPLDPIRPPPRHRAVAKVAGVTFRCAIGSRVPTGLIRTGGLIGRGRADQRRAGGDREAFDELVRRTFVDTFTLARRLTGNEEDARDVVQDAYLRAWRGIGKFRGEAPFSTWMYRITANAAATQRPPATPPARRALRRRPRTRRPARRSPAGGARRVGRGARPHLGTRSTSCPPKLRSVVVLKDVYDLSHEAIADELGISVAGGQGAAAPRPPQAARRAVRRRSRGPCGVTRSRRCCRGWSTATPTSISTAERHVETCLRCQAELARYRRLLRTLALLRTRYAEPTPGLLGETLAALTDAAEDGCPAHAAVGPPARVRRRDRRQRAVAAGATAAVLIARSRRRSMRSAG